jgi:hypothetical protein
MGPSRSDAAQPRRLFGKERIAMTGQKINERCEALFSSALQRSDVLTADTVTEAISQTVRALGPGGCASRMAQEFGDHPEAASERMRWAREILGDAPTGPSAATTVSFGCAA